MPGLQYYTYLVLQKLRRSQVARLVFPVLFHDLFSSTEVFACETLMLMTTAIIAPCLTVTLRLGNKPELDQNSGRAKFGEQDSMQPKRTSYMVYCR